MNYVKEDHRVYAGDPHSPEAEITFEEVAPQVYSINHTFVADYLKGQGIGGELVKQALEVIRSKGARAEATCSYAKAWMEKHPEA